MYIKRLDHLIMGLVLLRALSLSLPYSMPSVSRPLSVLQLILTRAPGSGAVGNLNPQNNIVSCRYTSEPLGHIVCINQTVVKYRYWRSTVIRILS